MKFIISLSLLLMSLCLNATEYVYFDSNWTKTTLDLDNKVSHHSDTLTRIKECSHELLHSCFIIGGKYFAIPKSVKNGDYSFTRIPITEDVELIFWDKNKNVIIFGQAHSGYSIQIQNIKSNTVNNVLMFNKKQGVLMYHNENGTFLSASRTGLFKRER